MMPGTTNHGKQKKVGHPMAMSVKKRNPDVKGREVHIVVDVHKRSWRVTALLEGVVVRAGSVPSTYEAFKMSSPIRRGDDSSCLRG
jgi:hypothetical protein